MATRNEGLSAVETEIGALLRRVKRLLGERAVAVHPDLQGAAYTILGWLEQNGPVRAVAIAECFKIDKGALSRQLQHLEELGLIDRWPDPDDGRASLVAVTDEARARRGQVERDSRKLAQEKLRDWTTEDFLELARLLNRYNETLD